MQLTAELKKQLDEQKKQCIFCKLISGEIPNAKKVFEDDKTVALVDIYPAVKGHVLFMLKEHYPLPVYILGDEFAHQFSLIPGLSKAIKSAMVKTGMNIFIALGGAAGQQSYHFMAHLLPREPDDKFYHFLLKKGAKTSDEEKKAISDSLCQALRQGPLSQFTTRNDEVIVYEDEQVLCAIPHQASAKGQINIYSKSEKYIEEFSQKDSAHLFSVAATASQVVFEALKAQGTNILLRSGEADDHPEGKLVIHVLPRWQNDGLQELVWEPKRPSDDLDEVASKIKDKMWDVKMEEKVQKEIKVEKSLEKAASTVQEEIMNAIAMIRGK